MIKGLSTAGLGQVKDIEQLIQLASENGFGAIDTSGNELNNWVKTKGLEEAKSFLHKHGVIIGSIGLSVEWRGTDEQFKEGLSTLLQDAQIAAAFDCKSCCTYVLPATDQKPAHYMVQATKRLRLCAQILKEYGVKLGLEFVGPHHLRKAWTYPFIWTMQETVEWIDVIGEPNVGLLLDSYHWYTTNGTVEDLLALDPAQITHVHINDAKDIPVVEVLDNDRLYPGEGVIDLNAFLKALSTIGYKGVVAQEILSPEQPQETAEVLAEKSGKAFEGVFSGIEN
ncbi:sugar phosphate isomerase/epimerase family protein [Lederbergia galactosidilytica]|uniref:Xylose isomerase n=1 Tax=Lederbergia galactosidilytica TaxID=217031 RepID=A0A178A223_9BACI|nr:sugar phosphate isomerase/epimerase family protein [Lederbergia galactosidilytica]KRG14449.1 xylose isomerase [Virgibacillus soli]MBP1914979.1 sugar phosphate isomerase/epimerase [Lederbergia galactosidilytica]OAK74257.1 xylose isomerase [Lederbergia galactosidilytica]